MMSLRIHYDLYGSIALHCLLSTETQGLLCGNRFNLEKEVYPPPLPLPFCVHLRCILSVSVVQRIFQLIFLTKNSSWNMNKI